MRVWEGVGCDEGGSDVLRAAERDSEGVACKGVRETFSFRSHCAVAAVGTEGEVAVGVGGEVWAEAEAVDAWECLESLRAADNSFLGAA